MTDDPLKRILLSILGSRPTPAQRRRIADELRALAKDQEQLADALEREHARPGERRVTARKPKPGPGRAPSRFVRIGRQMPYGPGRTQERLIVHVGRGLYYDAGSPARLDVQRLGGALVLLPATGDVGFAVRAGKGMPRFFADGARDLFDDLADGRYSAEVRGGRIEVGERME